MSGLETGRINVAARAVGVAQAAFNAAIRYAQQRESFGKPIAEHQAIQLKLADMATKIQAARLLVYDAATKKDAGGRIDLESGMAKLFASEVCGEVTMEAMRVHGGYGFIKESPVERYYRDAPLMIIGEGTNEVMRLVIARQLLRPAGVPDLAHRFGMVYNPHHSGSVQAAGVKMPGAEGELWSQRNPLSGREGKLRAAQSWQQNLPKSFSTTRLTPFNGCGCAGVSTKNLRTRL